MRLQLFGGGNYGSGRGHATGGGAGAAASAAAAIPPPPQLVIRPRADGQDIIKSTKVRTSLDTIVKQQGFDGEPDVVPNHEFRKLVAKNGVYMERSYGGTQSQVLQYQNDLYHGQFYIQTSGGAMYGRGMYAVSGKTNDPFVSQVRNSYAGSYGLQKGITERMTFKDGAKIVDYEKLTAMKRADKKSTMEDGAYAAAKGFDAIRVNKPWGRSNLNADNKFYVILNRTSLVISDSDIHHGF